MPTRTIYGLFAVLVAALFVAAFTVQAYESPMGSALPSYSGRVVGIIPEHKILTVEAGPNDQANFEVRADTSVTNCGKALSFNDLRIDDNVTITYSKDLGSTRLATDVETGMRC